MNEEQHVLGGGFYTAKPDGGRPSVLGVTTHDAYTVEQADQIREYGPALVRQLHETPGFLSGIGVGFGPHFVTITAWSDQAGPRRFAHQGTHGEAVRRVQAERFTTGGTHSLWVPRRIRRLLRCPDCDAIADTESSGTTCRRCDAPMAVPTPYL